MRRVFGFTYIGLLFWVAVAGAGLAVVGEVWGTSARRERERELLFVGEQFRQAIGRYYESSPGIKHYPRRLEDLLEDRRVPMLRRHLRKLYADPMTGKAEWGLVVQGDQILGVHSRSQQAPLKRANFLVAHAFFIDSPTYSDWRFLYTPDGSPSAGVAALAADTQARQPTPSEAALASLARGDTAPVSLTRGEPVDASRVDRELTVGIPTEGWVCVAARANDLRACGTEGRAAQALQTCKQAAMQRYRSCLAASINAARPFAPQ